MLVDHVRHVERWAYRRREREKLPKAFGDFIAGLAPWDWWVGITFRNEIKNTDAAVAAIQSWLREIEKTPSRPVGYVLAEEFGDWGGRFHCHLLVTGVLDLRRDFWWREAFRRFGRTKIEPFDPRQAAAYYTAKYAAKQLGNLHFGGTFAGCELHHEQEHFELRASDGTMPVKHGIEIVRSDGLSRDFFRMGLGRWHR